MIFVTKYLVLLTHEEYFIIRGCGLKRINLPDEVGGRIGAFVSNYFGSLGAKLVIQTEARVWISAELLQANID